MHSLPVLFLFETFVSAQELPKLELVLQPGHTGWVMSVAMSGDGKYVVTGSSDQTAILWEVAGGKKVKAFQHPNPVTTVAISQDGKYLVTGSNETGILWDVTAGKKLQTFKGYWMGVALSNDGKYVAM